MSDDYKTKILLEKSKQDKKANLFIKYIISIGFILFLGLVFFSFKEHFLSYFSLNLNEKNSFEEEKKKTAESNPLENNKLLEDMFITKHQKKVKIIHSPNKSIRPIFNLCRLNAKQVIKNHISKEDKYTFAMQELSNYLGIENIEKMIIRKK